MTIVCMDENAAEKSSGDKAVDSCDSVASEFYKSLQEAGIDNLLQFLSTKSDIELRLSINQQRGDPELDVNQKLTLLRTKLESSPGSFLFQYGKYLSASHLECFKSIAPQHDDVQYYLTQIQTSTPGSRSMEVKNRRYEALKKLVETTDYFSEEEMQRRNPILFNQLIGRYHSNEEREAFLYQSSQSTSSKRSSGSCPATPLTDMLIAHMNRGEGVCSNRRIDQEMQLQEEKQADQQYSKTISARWDISGEASGKIEEEEEEEDEEMEDDEEEVPEIDEAEKDLLKEEFFTTMYRHFLEGKDEDFPYDTVDDNTEYDVGETLDQDQEDKYFDDDQDEEADLEINQLQSINGKCLEHSSHVELQNGVESEEDELDIYMKEIEAQVKQQKDFGFGS